MSAVISLSEPAPVIATPVHGVGKVAFTAAPDGRSRLSDLYQSDPVRILFPHPPKDELPGAAFVTTSGGMVGGDRLDLSAEARDGAAFLCYPQAAEKIYRSNGATSRIDVSLRAGTGSWLEWLPQETIVFDKARLQRRTLAHVASDGAILAGEIIVLGRTAMGETLRSGLVRDEWLVHVDGKLIWADCFCLDGDIAATIDHPAGLAGASAIATIVYAASDAATYVSFVRELLTGIGGDVRIGTTSVNGLLLVRFMAKEALPLRRAFAVIWSELRQTARHLPAALPRLWQI